ncbi:MAG: zinc-binding dehydrogenase [Dehalococcoidia bacterium]
MKAAVLSQVGSPLAIEDIPTPKPRAGEVLVKIVACGVCHTDLHVIKGEVNFPLPAVLGHEISGIVEEVASDVMNVKLGDRVVGTFILPCGRCRYCARGQDGLCETFFALNRLKGVLYDGETRLHRADGSPLAMYSMGGMAEHAVLPATASFAVPSGVALEDSCILGCAIMTAYGAVKHQAGLAPAETVAVVGVGGVGSNIIQLARLAGASMIIAVDVRDAKLSAAQELGATHVVNAEKGDPVAQVREITGDSGVNVAFEALGRPETIGNAFNMAGDGGRVVVVGIGAGAAAVSIEITRLVRRGIRLIGSYGAKVRSDLPELLRLVAAGRIDVSRPISRRYSLAELNEAYGALSKGEITGRAIVVMEDAS